MKVSIETVTDTDGETVYNVRAKAEEEGKEIESPLRFRDLAAALRAAQVMFDPELLKEEAQEVDPALCPKCFAAQPSRPNQDVSAWWLKAEGFQTCPKCGVTWNWDLLRRMGVGDP